jgi:hypothetical protein
VLLLLPLLLAAPVPLSLLQLAQPLVLVPSFSIHAAVTVVLLVLVLLLLLLLLLLPHSNYNSPDYLTTLRVLCFYDLGVVLVLVKPTVHHSVLLCYVMMLLKHLSYVALFL